MPKRVPPFWSLVRVVGPNECWEFTSYLHKSGRGQYYYKGSLVYAHRHAFLLANGYLPLPGLCICHSCDNPICCNPAHLFVGTRADNVADMDSKGRRASFVGEKNPASKITRADAEHARRMRLGGASLKSIGAEIGVSIGQVHRIVNGQAWAKFDNLYEEADR